MDQSARTILSTEELQRLLSEDAPYGDLTTETLGIGSLDGTIRFTARQAMTVAAIEDAAGLLALAGVDVRLLVRSGDAVEGGTRLLEGEGPASALHRAWKVSQTLAEVWSGVATAAHTLIAAARSVGPDIVVACTRKNVPGTKALAAAAVRAGGATMHRLGLSETILVFPELLAAAGGITPDNAGDYVRAGADVLVSSWPYTARPADIAIEITPVTEAG
jgi:molybdenum transport protein